MEPTIYKITPYPSRLHCFPGQLKICAANINIYTVLKIRVV